MCPINVNVVRGRSYENFSTQKFIIRKFPNTKISRFTVLLIHMYQNMIMWVHVSKVHVIFKISEVNLVL